MDIVLKNRVEFDKKLDKLSTAVKTEIAKSALYKGAEVIETHAKLNIERHGLRDKGLLINSIKTYDFKSAGLSSYVWVGSRGVIYNRIHEFGGIISAKRRKYLAIPMTKTAKKAGSPLNMGELSFIKTNYGGVLLDKAGELQYVLKPSVMIPSRPYLRPAIDENRDRILEVMAKTIEGELKRV